MTRDGAAWLWTFSSGAALGAVVTAVACGRLEALGRLWDRILGDHDGPEPRQLSANHQASCVRLVRDDGPGGAA